MKKKLSAVLVLGLIVSSLALSSHAWAACQLKTVTWVVEELGDALAHAARAAIENPGDAVRYPSPKLTVKARESTPGPDSPLPLDAVQVA